MSKTLEAVIRDLSHREQRGLNKYGTTVDRTDLSPLDWQKHLYEELLDACMYLQRSIIGDEYTAKATEHFGADKQMVKAIEEMSELQKELSKNLLGAENQEAIREEIADCIIMLEQMAYLFDVNNGIEKIKKAKIERLKQRINDNS
jgi:NTP pyrophosphatase (non-canonical NTP hydrolase)